MQSIHWMVCCSFHTFNEYLIEEHFLCTDVNLIEEKPSFWFCCRFFFCCATTHRIVFCNGIDESIWWVFSFLFINFNRYLWHFNDDCLGKMLPRPQQTELETATSILIKKNTKDGNFRCLNQKLIIIVSILCCIATYSNAQWKWLLLFHLLYLYLAVYSLKMMGEKILS